MASYHSSRHDAKICFLQVRVNVILKKQQPPLWIEVCWLLTDLISGWNTLLLWQQWTEEPPCSSQHDWSEMWLTVDIWLRFSKPGKPSLEDVSDWQTWKQHCKRCHHFAKNWKSMLQLQPTQNSHLKRSCSLNLSIANQTCKRQLSSGSCHCVDWIAKPMDVQLEMGVFPVGSHARSSSRLRPKHFFWPQTNWESQDATVAKIPHASTMWSTMWTERLVLWVWHCSIGTHCSENPQRAGTRLHLATHECVCWVLLDTWGERVAKCNSNSSRTDRFAQFELFVWAWRERCGTQWTIARPFGATVFKMKKMAWNMHCMMEEIRGTWHACMQVCVQPCFTVGTAECWCRSQIISELRGLKDEHLSCRFAHQKFLLMETQAFLLVITMLHLQMDDQHTWLSSFEHSQCVGLSKPAQLLWNCPHENLQVSP